MSNKQIKLGQVVKEYRELLVKAHELRTTTWRKGVRTLISLVPAPADLGLSSVIGVGIQQKKHEVKLYAEEIDDLRDFLNEHFPKKEPGLPTE